MYCKNCGKNLSENVKFCSNCGFKMDFKEIDNNLGSDKIDTIVNNKAIINKNWKMITLFNILSVINCLIMVFYTFIEDGEGAGLFAAFLVAPFLMIPQSILLLLSLFKKSFPVLSIISFISAVAVTIFFVNYTVNIFIVLNILLLIIIFIYLLKNKNIDKV